jgi:putative sterol carrier protein
MGAWLMSALPDKRFYLTPRNRLTFAENNLPFSSAKIKISRSEVKLRDLIIQENSVSETTINDLIDLLCRSFLADRATGVDTSIQAHLTGEKGGDYGLVIKDQTCTVTPGTLPVASVKVEAAAQDVLDMYEGKLDPMKAFMQGKLRINGDKAMALKLTTLFRLA